MSFAKDDYLSVSERVSDSQLGNELSSESSNDSDYESAFNDYKDLKERRVKGNSLLLSDSAFSNKKNISLVGLISKVSMVVIALLGILFSVKFYLTRNNLLPQGGFFEELTQKLTQQFTNNFSTLTPNVVKLKQSLILTPGQNIYLVEVEGKKLLLSGTHQGGVQFLADLSDKAISNGNIDVKQIEEYQNNFGQNHNNVTYEIKPDINKQFKHMDLFAGPLPENPYLTAAVQNQVESANALKSVPIEQSVQKHEIQPLKPPFKRRSNFRKTLLSETVNSQDELTKIR